MGEKKQLLYGTKSLEYDLSFEDRKNLRIDVNPDQSIVVIAPHGSSLEKINEKLNKRRKWIIKQQTHFAQFNLEQPKRQYVSGESYRYLGKQYRLKVVFGADHVRLLSGRLIVTTTRKSDKKRMETLIDGWYRKRSETVFNQELCKLSWVMSRLQVDHPKLALRKMKTRWGSCHKNGTISLNPELLKASKSSIKYVLIHELCHLKEFTHSPKFYTLLDSLMPDWRDEKQQLNLMADRQV